jgi:hypothetical protein
MRLYNLYLFYDNILIGKFTTKTDNINHIYEEYSKDLIINALQRNIKIHNQIKLYGDYCKQIAKQTDHCYKIKMSDFILFLGSYFSLVKFNQIPNTDYLFLKKKSFKSRKNNINLK